MCIRNDAVAVFFSLIRIEDRRMKANSPIIKSLPIIFLSPQPTGKVVDNQKERGMKFIPLSF
jgi:hypothetical protein